MLRFASFTLALLLTSSALCQVVDDLETKQPLIGEATAVGDTFLCKVCGIFWEVVNDVLGDQKVDDWLIQYVEENICPKLPTEEAQEECVEKAPTFVPAIIHWAEGLANGTMCTDAGVCGDKMLFIAPVEMDQQEDEECQVCKNLMTVLKSEAQKVQPQTLVEKIKDLENDCDSLSGDEAEQCKEIVDKYGYLMVYFIEKERDADIEKACSDIGICPRPPSAIVVDPLPAALVSQMAEYAVTASNDESDCERCKAITNTAHQDLVNPDTQEAVIAYLSRACNWVPMYTQQCDEAVRTYTVQALDTIARHVNPDEVCDFLGVCGGESIAMGEANTVEEKVAVEQMPIQ